MCVTIILIHLYLAIIICIGTYVVNIKQCKVKYNNSWYIYTSNLRETLSSKVINVDVHKYKTVVNQL